MNRVSSVPLPVQAAALMEARRRGLRMVSANQRPHPGANALLAFITATKHDYHVGWHHGALCEYLERFVSGDIKRLMAFMPPRHGKSELVSRRLPAYILGKYPDSGIIACSYSADLSSRFNRDVQRIIDSNEYQAIFPGTRLYGANIRTVASGTYLRNSDIFEIVDRNGFYRSAGVGGGITGMGFNYGIIDDPVKNRKEANSLTVRDAIWDWYTSTFYTRQEKNAGILITVTRWNLDDLCGRLLTGVEGPDGEEWTILNFPAIKEDEPTELDPREPGEPLWEEKYDLAALNRIQQAIGPYDFAALYQQHPQPKSGGLFDTQFIEIIDFEPECVSVVRFYDLAVTKKKTSDYSVGVKFGLTHDERPVILHVWREQLSLPDVQEVIVQNAMIDGTDVPIYLEAEKAGIVQLDYLLRDPRMRPYTIYAIPPVGDKYTRAGPFASRVRAGKALAVRGSWNRAYLDELAAFPFGSHDDQVDASSGAYGALCDDGDQLVFGKLPSSVADWRG